MDHPLLACPLCHGTMRVHPRLVVCEQGHSFDRSREGYVNLLRPGKARKEVIGDDADMVTSRRSFLNRGHYRCLSEGLAQLFAGFDASLTLLDVGCGEGTFTRAMLEPTDRPALAFDISKPAVRLAARAVPRAVTAIASAMEMPVLDHSVDLLMSVMSPVHVAEFSRVARPGGRAVIVHPGADHLRQLRQLVYGDSARAHDGRFERPDDWHVVNELHFTDRVHLATNTEVTEVWGMTPYRWNSPREGGARVAAATELTVDVDFVATVLQA